ncbi:MAG: aminotransferase class III-fold pyridoxal phosphate-dependent enzyme, partial [Verrucomicrobiae bacterium]|nr:aminotransferase class III-fold pyridoxal phosphate-dependent enzyme [Verrucomicrobiae bacterium]
MHPLARLDLRYIWHPFTQMRDWLKREPIVIVSGRGAVLRDVHGRQYIDANSSIWTNLHGHNHPVLNSAIQKQLKRIAHSSALGLANEPASILAQQLVALANAGSRGPSRNTQAGVRCGLTRVFYSDDGSTAMEVALKLAYEFSRRSGKCKKPRFLTLSNAYHGDTIGAVSLGRINLFRRTWEGLLFSVDEAMAPYCYRCRYNRAKPERADARNYRKCSWECMESLEKLYIRQKKRGEPYAGFVFEPLIQGAAGMIPQPSGWLARAAAMAREYGSLLIADEVMTGFGRTGTGGLSNPGKGGEKSAPGFPSQPLLFACQHEGVKPDLMAVAKGMTGGYLPMAATLTTTEIFEAFLGEYAEFKTFFHGHSYTANQLGAAAALANIKLLQRPACHQSLSLIHIS